MEITWEKHISSSRDHHLHPSFSSTLLDQIYRSIDDSPTKNLDISPVYNRRSIVADFNRSRRTTTHSCFLRYCRSSSSDSSGFSSSDSGRSKSSTSPPPPPPPPPPKPIRTSVEKPNGKQEIGGFLRKKSKIYTDLKKVKQPISPGGRLATFINSLFTSAVTNTKKQKKTTSASVVEPNSASRSCLSKTPSSRGKSKRSVRFCPVNVILEQDSSTNDTKRERHVIEEENRRVIKAAKDLLRTYKNNKDLLRSYKDYKDARMPFLDKVDEDDDDDAASYDSSDLFELENLSAIGIKRYQEELPVYETTRLNTNRAIAIGLIL